MFVATGLLIETERIASTAGVRTHGDFGIIPSPYTVDFDIEIEDEIMMKVNFVLFRQLDCIVPITRVLF